MKKCQNCATGNADDMNFCVQCGTALPTLPNYPRNQSNTPTESFGNPRRNDEVETFQRNLVAPQTGQAKSSKKTFWILGGIFSLMVLLLIGVVGIIGVNAWLAQKNTPQPTPIRTVRNSPAPTDSPNISISTGDSPSPDNSPQPTVSFTPPSVPTKNGSFKVSASLGWQLSNIDVVPDENFTTAAKGKIDLDGLKKGVSTNGITDENAKSRRLYQEYPTGALLMRTRYADGKVSIIQPVTAPPSLGLWRNAPDERGKIEFCVNDNKPGLNTGQFTVSVVMINVPDAKK